MKQLDGQEITDAPLDKSLSRSAKKLRSLKSICCLVVGNVYHRASLRRYINAKNILIKLKHASINSQNTNKDGKEMDLQQRLMRKISMKTILSREFER